MPARGSSGLGHPVRRRLLKRVRQSAAGFALLGAGGWLAPAALRAQTAAEPRFVALALEMRRRAIERGDQPYGAVVVRGDEVLAEGVSAVVSSGDVRAHAEIVALREAARRLNRDDLSGCVLYGSSRACPMCEAFAHRMKISRMFYGERGEDAGAPRGGG